MNVEERFVTAFGSIERSSLKAQWVAIAAVGALASACTWVGLKPAGEAVQVKTAAEVAQCEKLLTATAEVKHKILIFPRGAKKVETELETLARNRAGAAGGDTIVPEGPVAEGTRSYGVYRCKR
jgi:hypothetical protein